MINRISIGTAQFGLDYGINNKRGKVTSFEVSEILNYSIKMGITFIDTASSYGNSEKVLGSQSLIFKEEFSVISKIAKINLAPIDAINKSLNNLNLKKIYCLLAHDFLIVTNHLDFYLEMLKLKEIGLVEKVGVSVYHLKELNYLIENEIPFDLVQIPYSILDQRFHEILPKLKEMRVEVHTRSSFLQGLIFMNPKALNESFNSAKESITELKTLSRKINVPISNIALIFALLNPNIDRVIIGVDSKKQLEENLNGLVFSNLVKENYKFLKVLNIDDEQVLLPYNWKK